VLNSSSEDRSKVPAIPSCHCLDAPWRTMIPLNAMLLLILVWTLVINAEAICTTCNVPVCNNLQMAVPLSADCSQINQIGLLFTATCMYTSHILYINH
jgi:hypothetical protein